MTEVRVYSMPQCVYCTATKRLLGKFHIKFREMVLTDEVAEMARADGHTTAPLVTVDYGDGVTTSWSGYRPTYIEQLSRTLSG